MTVRRAWIGNCSVCVNSIPQAALKALQALAAGYSRDASFRFGEDAFNSLPSCMHRYPSDSESIVLRANPVLNPCRSHRCMHFPTFRSLFQGKAPARCFPSGKLVQICKAFGIGISAACACCVGLVFAQLF
eukprot:s1376_g10.t1